MIVVSERKITRPLFPVQIAITSTVAPLNEQLFLASAENRIIDGVMGIIRRQCVLKKFRSITQQEV